jgi:hypothetical protein
MPQSTPWPPAPFDRALDKFNEWDALYIGDPALLTQAYSPVKPTHTHNGQPYTGGVVGKVASAFWGAPVAEAESRPQLHIPLPADMAQLSADLVFGESPKFTLDAGEPAPAGPDGIVPEDPGKVKRELAQARLDEIMGSDHARAELIKAGEYAAALGGAYLSLIWDKTFADIDHVWFRAFSADVAVPEFRHGRLYSVRLWSEFDKGATTGGMYRLIETHSPGSIVYTLWKGDESTLGYQVDVGAIPETEHIRSLLPATPEDVSNIAIPNTDSPALEVVLPTGTQKLTVKYMPNMLPQREWRKAGALQYLGRSDFAGVEPLFHELDRTWSMLVNDIELGQGRITVPEDYLENLGTGMGASFDLRRRIYSGLNILDQDSTSSKMTITQFEIRVQEHLTAIAAITRAILRSAGYSPSSFGEDTSSTNNSGAITATEVTDRDRASERTRDKKILYATPALAELAQVALEIDGLVYPNQGGGIYDLPVVEFPNVSQVDLEKLGRTLVAFDTVGAVSLKTKVEMIHPDWDGGEVDEEIDLIKLDKGEGAPADPTRIGTIDDPTVNDDVPPALDAAPELLEV